jgi:hypothetical protein
MTCEDIDFIIDSIETAIEWAEYADPYFQVKHGLESDKNNVRKSIELLNVIKIEMLGSAKLEGALDRKNEEIKDLIHSIESKNARIKELEAHNKELSKDFTHAKYVDLYAEPKTCETCKTHNYANSECDLLRYLPEFYRKEFGCIHHAPIDKG